MALDVTVMKDFYYGAAGMKFVLALEFNDDEPRAYTCTMLSGLQLPTTDPRYSANEELIRTPVNPEGYRQAHDLFVHRVEQYL